MIAGLNKQAPSIHSPIDEGLTSQVGIFSNLPLPINQYLSFVVLLLLGSGYCNCARSWLAWPVLDMLTTDPPRHFVYNKASHRKGILITCRKGGFSFILHSPLSSGFGSDVFLSALVMSVGGGGGLG